MIKLTRRQTEVLLYIQSRIEGGFPPTVREIGDAMGIASTNGVTDHLKALTNKGYIMRDSKKARSILVLQWLR